MSSILTTILPVFGLIALGYLSAKTHFIAASAGRGLSQYVFNMALPALLFRSMVVIEPQAAPPWGLWFAYFGALALLWIIAAPLVRMNKALAEYGGASALMTAAFGNLVMLGFPMSQAHFGDAATLPVSLIISIHAPILWLAATIHLETARHGKLSPLLLARQLGVELFKNPIVLALLAGSLWRLTNFGLHPVVDKLLDLLGDAGVPTALVALGLTLATYNLKGHGNGIAVLIALKMLLLPVLVWAMVTFVVSLPPLWTKVAVLLAAMPAGANAYLFAQRYDSATAASSGAIAFGTAFALFTTAILLWLMDMGLI
jgi:malonate transporter